MKKVFFAGLGILIAFSLMFTACEQVSDPEVILVSRGGFQISARKAHGGVLLTWEPVADAYSYEIWRQHSREGAERIGTLTRNDATRWADVKGLANDLKPGVNYRYTVIAINNPSTPVNTLPNVIAQNKAAARDVRFSRADLPETISLEPVTGLVLQITRDSKLLAAWNADANPLVKYEVTVNDVYEATTFTNAVLIDSFDLNNSVAVRKVLGEAYYKPSAPAGEHIALPQGDFAAVRDGNGVTITFPAINTDTVRLDQYELSRVKLSPVAGTSTPVSLDSIRLVEKTIPDPDDPDNSEISVLVYEVYDTLPDDTEYTSIWLYQLVVNRGSAVYYATTTPLATGKIGPVNLVFDYDRRFTLTDTQQDTQVPIIYATYNIETDADYALFLKPVTGSNGVNDGIEREWIPVVPASADKTTGTFTETVKITLPEARTKYNLKVVGTGKGAKAAYKSAVGIAVLAGSTTQDIQFRSPITLQSITPPALVYNLGLPGAALAYEKVEDSYTTAPPVTIAFTLYELKVQGLTNSASAAVLRAGEVLKIELSPRGSAPMPASIYASQTLVRAGSNYINAGGVDTPVSTQSYYFKVPYIAPVAGTSASYDIRLYVTAK